MAAIIDTVDKPNVRHFGQHNTWLKRSTRQKVLAVIKQHRLEYVKLYSERNRMKFYASGKISSELLIDLAALNCVNFIGTTLSPFNHVESLVVECYPEDFS